MREEEKVSFEIATKEGWESIDGHRVGSLAVHHPRGKKTGWLISHIATGLSIPTIAPGTKAEALDMAEALQSDVDWSGISRGQEPGDVLYNGVGKDAFKEAVISVNALYSGA